MKCRIMRHFIRVYTVKVKKIFRQNNTIFFLNYNLTPLDMYNGLSQVYCIEPEEKFLLFFCVFFYQNFQISTPWRNAQV